MGTGSGSYDTPLIFKNAYIDTTGLIYMQARWYDSTTGQFLSQDPDVDQTLQPFAFAGDQAVTDSDPTGMFLDCGEEGCGGGAVPRPWTKPWPGAPSCSSPNCTIRMYVPPPGGANAPKEWTDSADTGDLFGRWLDTYAARCAKMGEPILDKIAGVDTETDEDVWIEIWDTDSHVVDHLNRWRRVFGSVQGLLDRINAANGDLGEVERLTEAEDGLTGWRLTWGTGDKLLLKEFDLVPRVVNGVKELISKCDLFDVYEK